MVWFDTKCAFVAELGDQVLLFRPQAAVRSNGQVHGGRVQKVGRERGGLGHPHQAVPLKQPPRPKDCSMTCAVSSVSSEGSEASDVTVLLDMSE